MKIGVLTSSYPQFKHDNAGIFVYNLVKKIASKKSIQQCVITPHSKESKFFEEKQRYKVFRFPYFFPLSLQKLCYGAGIVKNIKQNKFLILLIPCFLIAEILSLLIVSKKESFDLIHAHWIIPQGVIAYLCKIILKTPYIVSIHGSDILAANNPLFQKICKVVLSNADSVTANSGKTTKIASSIVNKNIETIPMGVDLDLFHTPLIIKEKMDQRERLQILFVGRLIDLKGVNYLLDAIVKVQAIYPDIVLKIIGDGPEKSGLQERVKDLGIKKNVTFGGVVPNYKLPGIYRDSDIFVIPSIVNENGETEGLGIVTLEAMACGTPVIGTNVGGIPDIIKDRITGLLVEEKNGKAIADSILEIIQNTSLRDDMCKNAHQLVQERFSWDVIARRFLKLYKKIL